MSKPENVRRSGGEDHDGTPKSKRVSGAVVGLVGLTAATAVVAGVRAPEIKLSDDKKDVYADKRFNAVKSADQLSRKVVVFKEGSNFRFTPELAAEKTGTPDNIAGSVPKGKEYVLQMPQTSSSTSEFVGALKPGVSEKSIDSVEERAENTIWFELDELKRQGKASVYELPGQQTSGDTILAHVDSFGAIVTKSDIVNSVIGPDGQTQYLESDRRVPGAAISAEMPAGAYQDIAAK